MNSVPSRTLNFSDTVFSSRSLSAAETARSPAYALLAVDSEDRFRNYTQAAASNALSYNASSYNFQITKNESIMNGFFTRLAVTEVCFPWMIGNILDSTSEMYGQYQIGAGPVIDFQIDISDNIGFLRPSQIASLLQTKIRAVVADLSGFTMTYGSIAGSNATYPWFEYNTNNPSVVIAFRPVQYSVAFPYPNTQIQLFNLLGFDAANTVLDTGETSKSTYCQSIRYIDIVSPQLTYNQALKDTMTQPIARDSLCRLYLGDGPYTATSTLAPNDPNFCPPGCAPFTIYRQFTNPKFIRWTPNQPVQGNLIFQVYDDGGTILSETDVNEISGQNWSMTLLVSED